MNIKAQYQHYSNCPHLPMISLTVCNHKGGTGKTTSIISLASAFGLSGMRVLVVDLDPQGFLSRVMGVGETAVEASSVMLFNASVDPAVIPRLSMEGFDLIPSSPSLTSEMRRLNKGTDVLWLKEFAGAMSSSYDVILYDTAAALTVFSLNALVASQHVLIPVLPEYQPVLGAEQMYRTCAIVRKKLNPALRSPRFLLTMVDGRKRTHARYSHYLREKYGTEVLHGMIRTCATLATSERNGRTVFTSNPRARGSIDYANAADELLTNYMNSDQQNLAHKNEEDAAGVGGLVNVAGSGVSGDDTRAVERGEEEAVIAGKHSASDQT